MYYCRKWKPSKTKAREFAKKREEINIFCERNNISQSSSSDSYYFTIGDIAYRVSNHAIEKSYYTDVFGDKIAYHGDSKDYRDRVFCINASKTRIIEIYGKLKSGKKLDHNGNEIRETK